jgi:predicted ABC-type ATPase
MNSAQPWFVLVAGINGAGKSTFAQTPTTIRELCGLMGTSDEFEIINPDLITKQILRAAPRLSLDDANKQAADAAPTFPSASPKSETTGFQFSSATLDLRNFVEFGHG